MKRFHAAQVARKKRVTPGRKREEPEEPRLTPAGRRKREEAVGGEDADQEDRDKAHTEDPGRRVAAV
jgi:hypothetical protein